MDALKSFTPTLFGFLIAYVIPGLSVVIAVSLFSKAVANQLLGLSTATAPSGLVFMLFLTAILGGLQLNIVRWAIYEKGLGRKHKLESSLFGRLGSPEKAPQFTVLVDQVYRYHQFSGAQSIVIPLLAVGIVKATGGGILSVAGALTTAGALIVEGLSVWSAIVGWNAYVDRCTALANGK